MCPFKNALSYCRWMKRFVYVRIHGGKSPLPYCTCLTITVTLSSLETGTSDALHKLPTITVCPVVTQVCQTIWSALESQLVIFFYERDDERQFLDSNCLKERITASSWAPKLTSTCKQLSKLLFHLYWWVEDAYHINQLFAADLCCSIFVWYHSQNGRPFALCDWLFKFAVNLHIVSQSYSETTSPSSSPPSYSSEQMSKVLK